MSRKSNLKQFDPVGSLRDTVPLEIGDGDGDSDGEDNVF